MAQLAARNALTYNFSLVFTTLQELPTLELKDELTKQLEEAEQARREMARLEHELDGAYAELEKIQDRLDLREKARYNSTRAGDLSVAEDVSSLFMHVSTQPHRSPFVQSMQTTLDRIGDLAELYNGFANKIKAVGQSVDNYARQYPHMAEKLETVKGYLSQATAHVPQVTSAAGYAMSMILGALEGMALGSMAGGIGAAPGAAIGMATGYTSAVVADKVIDASAPHIHSKLSEFADYAQSIGRDELESSRNRYLADAMGNAALTGLAVVGMTRGKPASKSIVSGLDLAGVKNSQARVSWTRNINRQHFQDHHIISNKNNATASHPLWELAGMNPNDRANRMFLPTLKGVEHSTTQRSIHQGRHAGRVHKNLVRKMDKVEAKGTLNNWTQSDYAKQLKSIISKERQALKSGDRILNKHQRSWATDKS